MIVFWSVAAALTVVALAFMVVPLVRKVKVEAKDTARAEFDLTVYKDQLKEIDRDMDRGVLSEDQAQAARTEIERRMLAAAQDKDEAAPKADASSPGLSMALMIAIVIAVPAGTIGGYYYLGQPGAQDQPLAQRQQQMQNHAQGGQSNEEMRAQAMELIAKLEQRLKDNPNDLEGWAIMADVHTAMNKFNEAAAAYEHIAKLTDRHPEPLVLWAESLIYAENTVVIPAAVELLKEVKEKDPSEPRSYFYLALERQQHDDLEAAMDEYVQLLKVSPSDAEWVPQIQDRLRIIAGELEVEIPVVELLPPAEPTMPVGPGPTAEQMQDAAQMSAEERNAMVQAMVNRLAERLKENPDDLAGWQRLMQAYEVMGNAEGVAEAAANIKRLSTGSGSASAAPATAAPGPTAEQMRDAQNMSVEDRQAMIQNMVQRLADKLKDNPDDLAGWQRLAQAYRVTGNTEGLAEAEANIKRLQGR